MTGVADIHRWWQVRDLSVPAAAGLIDGSRFHEMLQGRSPFRAHQYLILEAWPAC